MVFLALILEKQLPLGKEAASWQIIKKFLYFKRYHDHGHKLLKDIPRGIDNADMPGFNYRMTELQAAVGISQIQKLDYILSESKKRFLIMEKFSKIKLTWEKFIKGQNRIMIL